MINIFEDGLERNRVNDCPFTPLNEVAGSEFDLDYHDQVEVIGDIDYETLLGSGDPNFVRIASSEDHPRG
ncbi:hypothetical protein [Caballeronia sp. S22]|uniref:hypothetical protein n=1 Tax=Caballeronia sp. S22 TaxID=3137182 RepID=UPI003530F4C0